METMYSQLARDRWQHDLRAAEQHRLARALRAQSRLVRSTRRTADAVRRAEQVARVATA